MQHDLAVRVDSPAGEVVTLHLGGVIDAHTLDKFERALKQIVEAGTRSVLLDCEELRYVNSSGFGELVRYSDQLRARQGLLVLTRVPPKVAIILEMLGLKSLIPVVATLEEGRAIALGDLPPPTETMPVPETPASGIEQPREVMQRPVPTGRPAERQLEAGSRSVVCVFCATRVRIGGEGRWICPACGAPFSATEQGGVAFDWSRADADPIHLTFDLSPRTLAAFAGTMEGILTERRVAHARMRRFSREAAHVCNLIAEHAFEGRKGPLHVLALAGPQRLHLRVVDRGRALGSEAGSIFATQARLFLDFRYSSHAKGVNVTEFAFAYEGSGVFVA
ncbi:MAG: STAS domain-containing protein [Planctomycetota bacterium]|nr:STAS domain-containing protein [Planctomycetota bacterium]